MRSILVLTTFIALTACRAENAGAGSTPSDSGSGAAKTPPPQGTPPPGAPSQGAPTQAAPNGAAGSAAQPGQGTPTTPPGATGAQEKAMDPKATQEMHATFKTSMGVIRVKLFPQDAPKTVENFVSLAEGTKEWTDPKTNQKVKKPLYDGTIFHRVIPEFMIQGGDPLGTGTGGPGYRFEDEFQSGRRFDKPGILAMANAGPGTNGSQFFITEVPTPHLSNRHTIFGEVVSGQDIVNKIARAPTAAANRPLKPIVLEKVTIERK